jgi:glutathione peroxidase
MKPSLLLFSATLLAISACVRGPESKPGQEPAKPAEQAKDTEAADMQAAQDAAPAGSPAGAPAGAAGGVYALEATSIDGDKVSMADYAGKVTLIVNVASECGYTRQYAGLQALHSEMADKGFAVLGFPSNEFGGQEPGSEADIKAFCSDKFQVTFPMFSKIKTKAGDGQSPIYTALSDATKSSPSWNFCKYLIGKDGTPIAFYKSGTAPDSAELRKAIAAALE